MAADLDTLCDDLLAEGADLMALVEPLDAEAWLTPTPAAGWSIRDQVTHLARFDDLARLAITDPDRFRAELPDLAEAEGMVDRAAEADRAVSGPDALVWLRTSRQALTDAARASDPRLRVPWYGPDMTVVSSITARLMETWAHGQDVADALGVERVATDRLRHVAFICARTVPNSYVARGCRCPTSRCGSSSWGPAATPGSSGPKAPPTWCGDPRSTSAWSPPSAATATTPRWWPSGPSPTSGSRSRRPSPDHPGPAGHRRPPPETGLRRPPPHR